MEEIVLLDAVERYLGGEMTTQEKSYFEDLRRTNAEVDQMVVEHQLFLHRFESYNAQKDFRNLLNETHKHLMETGTIAETATTSTRVIRLWNKHRRTIAVAASIACVTALTISGMLSYFAPKNAVENQQQIQVLSREINKIKKQQNETSLRLAQIDSNAPNAATVADDMKQISAGSSFLIDIKGYLATNSHVINGAQTIVVSNNGKDYYATAVYNDPQTDLAILKIQDSHYTAPASLPYSIRKGNVQLGEEIFTLGYPRNSIVYGKGYLSAQTGHDDDTSSVQISVDANPGNSGGPVFDKNGDVIGILNSREKDATGVVFANRAANLTKLIEKLKNADTSYRSVKLNGKGNLKGKDAVQQVDQLKGYVFMVKVFSK